MQLNFWENYLILSLKIGANNYYPMVYPIFCLKMYKTKDYDYDLPESLIAQNPVQPPDNSKLLVCQKQSSWYKYMQGLFKDISNFLSNESVLFFNNSKVVKAQVFLQQKEIVDKNNKHKFLKSGQVFFLDNLWDNRFEAMVFPGDKFIVWAKIYIEEDIFIMVEKITIAWRILRLHGMSIHDFLEKHWTIPLPPYIQENSNKKELYQTNFAQIDGSTAAPTAWLHFTNNLMSTLQSQWIIFEYLTLHIWIWTFKPIITEDIREYDIHQEKVIIDKQIFEKIADYYYCWKDIVWVGTTSTRVLESLPYLWDEVRKNFKFDQQTIKFRDFVKKQSNNEIQGLKFNENQIEFYTKVFIYPWFEFKIVQNLITNFHLPQSSLLALVAWFMGYENLFDAYHFAIQEEYRFFSFGDAMFIKNK